MSYFLHVEGQRLAPLRENKHDQLPTPRSHSWRKNRTVDLKRDYEAGREIDAAVQDAHGGLDGGGGVGEQLRCKVLVKTSCRQAQSLTGQNRWNVKRARSRRQRHNDEPPLKPIHSLTALMTEAWNDTNLLPLRKILNENVSVAAAHLTFPHFLLFFSVGFLPSDGKWVRRPSLPQLPAV